ncbi:MAG: hypothetical protein ABI687_08575, partial [Flavitalea sp.]
MKWLFQMLAAALLIIFLSCNNHTGQSSQTKNNSTTSQQEVRKVISQEVIINAPEPSVILYDSKAPAPQGYVSRKAKSLSDQLSGVASGVVISRDKGLPPGIIKDEEDRERGF